MVLHASISAHLRTIQLASLSINFTKFGTADVKLFGLLAKKDSKISLARRRRILAGAKYAKNIQELF